MDNCVFLIGSCFQMFDSQGVFLFGGSFQIALGLFGTSRRFIQHPQRILCRSITPIGTFHQRTDRGAILRVPLCRRDRGNNRPKHSHALLPVYTTLLLVAHRDGLHRNCPRQLRLRGVLVLPLCEPSRFRHTVFCIRGSPNNTAPVPIALLPLRSRHVVVIFQIAGPYLPNIYCFCKLSD